MRDETIAEKQRSSEPPSTNPWAVLAVVALGTMLGALSGSSVNLALPALGRDLDIPIEDAGWVVESYLIAVTVLLLVAGRFADQVGHRAIYLWGFVIFGLGSMICALAPSFELLIAARVVQGVGGAMIMATGPALLTTAFPASQRGRALGMLGTATYVGLTLGPPVGGALLAWSSWRAVFWINVPGTIVIMIFGYFLLPRPHRREKGSFDLAGMATLVTGLPLLLLAVGQGTSWGWASWPILTSLVAGAALVAAFVVVESRSPEPLLQLSLFRSRRFSFASLSAVCNYIALFVAIILLPYALMEGLEISEGQTGLVLAAQSILMAVTASPAGWASDRLGSRALAATGMIVLAGGLWGLSSLGPETELWSVGLWLAVMGLGTGMFISPNSSALMGAAPSDKQGTAGGVLAVSRNLGMMLGIALAITIYRAAGGRTGHDWIAADYDALRVTLLFAAGISLFGGIAAAASGGNQRTTGSDKARHP